MFTDVKLGCLPAKPDGRTLRMRTYLQSAAVPEPPARVDWETKLQPLPMYLNDRIGCCGVATPAHLMRSWSINDGAPYQPTDQQVLADYIALTGYDPQTGRNDTGVVLLDRMNYWRKRGIAGNRLGAYAGVNWQDHREVKASVHLFGGVDFGIQLPLAWQSTDVWDAPPSRFAERRFAERMYWRLWGPGSWGGHNAPAVGYDYTGLKLLTWGQVVTLTWRALEHVALNGSGFVVEAYADFDSLWVGGDGQAPNGFDVAALNQDLRAIGAN